MANENRTPLPTVGAHTLYDELGAIANALNEIRGVCERAYALSRSAPSSDLWLSGEFPFALGTVMARTWQALERLELVYGVAPVIVDDEQRIERGRELVEEYRRKLHQEFGGAAALRDLDPFKRPPGCLCREVVGGALKIEDYCPAHHPRRPP